MCVTWRAIAFSSHTRRPIYSICALHDSCNCSNVTSDTFTQISEALVQDQRSFEEQMTVSCSFQAHLDLFVLFSRLQHGWETTGSCNPAWRQSCMLSRTKQFPDPIVRGWRLPEQH